MAYGSSPVGSPAQHPTHRRRAAAASLLLLCAGCAAFLGGGPSPLVTHVHLQTEREAKASETLRTWSEILERVASLDALGFTWSANTVVSKQREHAAKTIESALTRLPATLSGAQSLTWRKRGRLNTMLRNAVFAEFGLSVTDVQASGAAGIRATLDRVRRDARWQSSSFRDIKPTGMGPGEGGIQ